MKPASIAPPRLTRGDITAAADRLIKRYIEFVGSNRVHRIGISFDEVYETVIYPEFEIELVEDRDLGFTEGGKKILGAFDVFANRAYIDASLSIGTGDPRRAWTCWHEVGGHGILHGRFLRDSSDSAMADRRLVTTADSLGPGAIQTLERQANFFAANASAPKWLVQHMMVETFRLDRPFRYIGPGFYDFEVRGSYVKREASSFEEFCCIIARWIRHRFWGLSVQSLGFRVKESEFAVDCTRQQMILRRIAS